jgi:hypothetical protein
MCRTMCALKRLLSVGTSCHVVWYRGTSMSKECATSTLRVEDRVQNVNCRTYPYIRWLIFTILSIQENINTLTWVKVRVKLTLQEVTKAQKGGAGIQIYPFTSALDRGVWSMSCHGRFTLVKTWKLLHMRLGGPLGRSGQVQKTSPPLLAFDPRTVWTVASRYMD